MLELVMIVESWHPQWCTRRRTRYRSPVGPDLAEILIQRRPRIVTLSISMANDHHTRVLIVDDNHDAVDLLNQLLTMQGYVTSVAYDGFMALDVAMSFAPQIVILDLSMPKFTGDEVAPMLRQVSKLENAFIIALTSWGDSQSRALTARAGFDVHLTKPLKADELFAALDAGRRALAELAACEIS